MSGETVEIGVFGMFGVTEEQVAQATQGTPVRLKGPDGRQEFVLVRADQFDRIQNRATEMEEMSEEQAARFARYRSPEFTQELLQHCNSAIQHALQEAPE